MTQPYKGTILLIDDDDDLRAILEMALRNDGYEVVSAHDGEDGLSKLSQTRPQLVLTDVMMPNLDGVEFFHTIVELLQGHDIPIILITALSRKPWFADIEAEGGVFLQKPFDVQQLVDLVNVSLMK